jgi:magnesium-transporting ATPase (P-type)
MKNTVYSIGVAVYTGPHTKVMKNSENSRYKVSRIEDLMNSLIFKLLILQALMYFGSVVGFLAWNVENKDLVVDFLPKSGFSLPVDTILMIFTYFVIYNTLLPISLIVSIDIVKMVQAYFIGVDSTFYNEKLKIGCRVMTSSINEELGQVEYVFSDKTGTLTCNIMELKYLGIGNVIYEGVLDNVTSEHNKYAK